MSYPPIPDTFPVLRGHGLTLRELTEADLPAWFARLSDTEAATLAGDPVATSIDVVDDGLQFHRQAFRDKTGLRWAIVPDNLGASVGSIGLSSFDPVERVAEVGAAIGRAHWNQGIATRAGLLVFDYAFTTLDLTAIHAVVLRHNAPVIRVLAKLGFAVTEQPAGNDAEAAEGASLRYVLRPAPFAARLRQ